MNNEHIVDYDQHDPENATNPEQANTNIDKPEVTNGVDLQTDAAHAINGDV